MITIYDMNEEELREVIKRERKQRLSLRKRVKELERAQPIYVEVEGNKGGSYVRLMKASAEGMVHLEVGESCVVTVQQEISVAALAIVLTYNFGKPTEG